MEFEEIDELQKIDLLTKIGDFLKAARRHIILGLVLVLVFGTVFAGRSYLSYHPRYTAYASFTVKVSSPLYSGVNSYNAKTAEQMAATFPSILTSGVLQERIRSHLDIAYMPSVSVSASANTSIITMSVQDTDPQQAYDVLNAIITYYPEIAEYVVGPTVLILLDESGIPEAPDNPLSITQSAIRGAALGAALWCAILMVMTLLKNTVHSEEELKKVLNSPCLGHIPMIKIPGRTACPLVTKHGGRSGFGESVRLLRIRVQKAMGEDNKVLLVSSAIPGEGKTTVSTNLAISLAQHGKKVLLIDCDLHNPSVANALGVSVDHSLSDFITDRATARDIVVPSGIKNLALISGSDSNQSNAAELLSHGKTTALIQACRRLYDYVILDTPPCSLLADASEIAEAADCGLLVIRHDFASRSQILDGSLRLNDGGLPIIGCTFNSVRYSLGSSYGYGYGYGYGNYGAEIETTK